MGNHPAGEDIFTKIETWKIKIYFINILDNAPCLRRRSHDTGDDLVVVESNDASVLRRLVDAAPGVPAVQGGEGGAVH